MQDLPSADCDYAQTAPDDVERGTDVRRRHKNGHPLRQGAIWAEQEHACDNVRNLYFMFSKGLNVLLERRTLGSQRKSPFRLSTLSALNRADEYVGAMS